MGSDVGLLASTLARVTDSEQPDARSSPARVIVDEPPRRGEPLSDLGAEDLPDGESRRGSWRLCADPVLGEGPGPAVVQRALDDAELLTSLCHQPTDLGVGSLLSNGLFGDGTASDLDCCIIHAGGPRILDDLSKFLRVDPHTFPFSRATLTEYGNIAAAARPKRRSEYGMTEEALTETVPPIRDWPALDLTGVDFDPVLTELMREGPVTRIRLPDGEGWAWLVTRHDDVRTVTDDPRFSREVVMDRPVTPPAPHFIPQRGAIGFLDPPDHTRLRGSVAAAFTAKGVERVRERSRRMLDELVEELLQDGPPADLTAAVLSPFPIAVVCELMGVPAADRHAMHTWTQLILSSSHGAKVSEKAQHDMGAYFADLIGRREGSSGEDVTSLLGAAVGRAEITLEEAVGLAALVQIGGEAVTSNSTQMFHLLLTRPELAERLRDEPEIRPRAIDELLRYIPHRNAAGPPRIAREDVEISGVRIRAGDPVHVSYLAANRDPEVFPDPETIDFLRAPNPHVSFGFGPHYCPGGMLARLESELLVDALLDGVPGLKLAVPPDRVPPFRKGALIRGPEALPVTW